MGAYPSFAQTGPSHTDAGCTQPFITSEPGLAIAFHPAILFVLDSNASKLAQRVLLIRASGCGTVPLFDM